MAAEQHVAVSVVVCTHGRTASLAATLRSLEIARSAFNGSIEVIVVDNAPLDWSTREVVTTGFPSCRYVLEQRKGLSVARNRGVDVAKGDAIAFVDDDVVVEPAWVQDLTLPIRSGVSDLASGTVYPGEGRRPAWMGPLVTSMHFIDVPIGPTSLLMGASFAVRRTVFAVLRFDPALGAGSSLGSGEDLYFARKAEDAGFRLHGTHARARHDVDMARFEYVALKRAALQIGRSAGYVSERCGGSPTRPFVTASKLRLRTHFERHGPIDGSSGISDREFDLWLQYGWCREVLAQRWHRGARPASFESGAQAHA